MADSLVDLKSQMDAPEANDAPEVVPTNAQDSAEKVAGEPLVVRVSVPTKPAATPTPGDKLMARAQELADFTPVEKEQAKLIRGSLDLLIQKGKEDPTFGARAASELAKFQGEAYAEKAVDLADKIKIDYLKRNFPDRFNGPQAAMTAFLNEATFGQLTRLIGGAGALINGQPYEEVVKQKAEEFRLLAKEYPKLNIAGQAAAFLIPGSPTKALFETVSGLGAKGATAIIKRIVANPGLMAKALGSAASGAAAAGAVGAVQGGLGKDNEDAFNLDRAIASGEAGAVGGGVIGAMLPPAGAAISAGVRAAVPAVRGTARAVTNTVGRVVKEFSGVSPNALRTYNRAPQALRQAFGTEGEIGLDLVDFLLDDRRSHIKETAQANELLDRLPDVSASRLINFLRGFRKGVNPEQDAAVRRLHQWADRIEARLPQVEVPTARASRSAGLVSETQRVSVTRAKPDARIPARLMRQFVDELQDAAKDQFGRESNFYKTAVKTASRAARMSIVETAEKEGGEAGEHYVKLMQKAAEKVGILKYISRQLGREPAVMAQRSQAFIDRILGKNKEFVAARMADLDTKFGTNFLERARLAQIASDVGEKGIPSYFSNHPTGRSLLGMAIGGAAGGVVGHFAGGHSGAGAAIGAVASSPRAGALIIGSSDAMTGFARRMVANPEAIARLAGMRLSKLPRGVGEGLARGGDPATRAAYDAGARGLAALRVPVEIQRIAQEIQRTLVKDGPKSAAGTIRLIADTPYFLGLVHYFELAERRQRVKTTDRAIASMRQP
jgi:hypothetical protein